MQSWTTSHHKCRQEYDGIYEVSVQSHSTLSGLFGEIGYSWISSHINDSVFPRPDGGGKKVVCELGDFGVFSSSQTCQSETVLAALEARGLRAAKLIELVSFGREYLHSPCDFSIVALGSVGTFGDRRVVPRLIRGIVTYSLRVDWFDRKWDSSLNRFLAVKL